MEADVSDIALHCRESSGNWTRCCWKILVGLLVLRLALMAVVPVFEPSEARYAAISANMARTGDFVVPRFTYDNEYQSFDGKPPLVFQAGGMFCRAAMGLIGQAGQKGQENPYALQFAVRLFPLLSAVLLLVILFHAVKRSAGAADPTEENERAWLAVVICATCTAFYAAAGMAMTDMTLTCCVAGALLLYELGMRNEELGMKDETCHHSSFVIRHSSFFCRAGVAALLGTGMITKGPVALVLFGLPVLVDAIVNRHWKFIFDWRWLVVAPIFFIIAVPWFVLIEQRNPGAVWYFFYNENFMRFISHDYGDKYGAGREAFRGVSVLWALVATLPWALLPAWNAGRKLVRRVRGGENVEQKTDVSPSHPSHHLTFDLIALLSIVGFWCLTSRVLLYYLFPMIPLFAAALAKSGDRTLLKRLVPWCAGASALVLSVGLVGGMFFSEKMMGPKTPFSVTENHYANEFYHGTKPPEEIRRLKAEHEAKQAAMMAKWMEWRRQREEEARRKAEAAEKAQGK